MKRLWPMSAVLVAAIAAALLSPQAASAWSSDGWSGFIKVVIESSNEVPTQSFHQTEAQTLTFSGGDTPILIEAEFHQRNVETDLVLGCQLTGVADGTLSTTADVGVAPFISAPPTGSAGDYVLTLGTIQIQADQTISYTGDPLFCPLSGAEFHSVITVNVGGSTGNSHADDGWTVLAGTQVYDLGATTITVSWNLSRICANEDTDDDGLNNCEEAQLGTDPTNPDSDGDGLNDGDEVRLGTAPGITDTDGDTLSDGDEVHTFSTSPTEPDTDGDGLDDGDEILRGTDPNVVDTDGDGISDGDEVDQGTDPLDPNDPPPGGGSGGGLLDCLSPEVTDALFTAASGDARVVMVGPDPHLFQYNVNVSWCHSTSAVGVTSNKIEFGDIIADPILAGALESFASVTFKLDLLVPPTVEAGPAGTAVFRSSAVFEGCYSPIDVFLNVLGGKFVEGAGKAFVKYGKNVGRKPAAALRELRRDLENLADEASEKFEKKIEDALKKARLPSKIAEELADEIDDGFEFATQSLIDILLEAPNALAELGLSEIEDKIESLIGGLAEACGPLWTPDFVLTLYPNGTVDFADEGSLSSIMAVEYDLHTDT